jgi:hypothetical protein
MPRRQAEQECLSDAETEYDELLSWGVDRQQAREHVQDDIDEVMEQWIVEQSYCIKSIRSHLESFHVEINSRSSVYKERPVVYVVDKASVCCGVNSAGLNL